MVLKEKIKDFSSFLKLFDLSNHVALVTGGAQGNGLAIAEYLALAGSDVVSTDIQFTEHEIVLEHNDSKIKKLFMDVSDLDNVKSVVDEIKNKYGKIDILINNAGLIYKDKVEDLKLNKWKKVIDVNLTGPTICTKLVVPIMKKNKWGRIINISSTQAFLHTQKYSAYAASKAALSHLTKVWASELATFNINVNAVCPGYVMTPMMNNSILKKQKEEKLSREEVINLFEKNVPQGRLLNPEEVAFWVLILCSEASRSVTGINISISGGEVMH